MRDDNIAMLQDTLSIMGKGYYVVNGSKVNSGIESGQSSASRRWCKKRRQGTGAYWGYKHLILGAFGNDTHVVSDLFYKALKELEYNGMHENDFFRSIDFAVMDHSADQYNFREFSRNFTDFYRERG